MPATPFLCLDLVPDLAEAAGRRSATGLAVLLRAGGVGTLLLGDIGYAQDGGGDGQLVGCTGGGGAALTAAQVQFLTTRAARPWRRGTLADATTWTIMVVVGVAQPVGRLVHVHARV